LTKLIADNGGYLPASTKNDITILKYASDKDDSLAFRIDMSVPLLATTKFKFITPEQIATNPIPNGQEMPNWDIFTNTPNNMSVSIGTNLVRGEEFNTIEIGTYWRNSQFDLTGNPYNGESQDLIRMQANNLNRMYLYFLKTATHYNSSQDAKLISSQGNWYRTGSDGNFHDADFHWFYTYLNKLGGLPAVSEDDVVPEVFK
jgi:hypothetical protein